MTRQLCFYAEYAVRATAMAAEDLALVLALPLLERWLYSGRLDDLVHNRRVVMEAERTLRASL